MDVIRIIEREWDVISGAPFSVATLALLAAIIGFFVSRYRHGAVADIARERLQAEQEQRTRLAEELDELKRTASSDASLAELRARIESLPRIFTGPEPPEEAPRDGDIWLQTAE